LLINIKKPTKIIPSVLFSYEFVIGHCRQDASDKNDCAGRIKQRKDVPINERRIERDEAGDEGTTPTNKGFSVPFLYNQILYRRNVSETDKNLRKDIRTKRVAGENAVNDDSRDAAEIPLLEWLEKYSTLSPKENCYDHERDHYEVHGVQDTGTKVVLLGDGIGGKA